MARPRPSTTGGSDGATRLTERSRVEIARWTLETFGLRQAEAYETDLIACCAAIAAGEAPSQDCRRLIDPNLPEDLRVTRAGQHFIVFGDMPDQVIVVGVHHSRSDLPLRLAAMGAPKDSERH